MASYLVSSVDYEAKIRTFRSTQPVAMTHRMPAFAASPSFFLFVPFVVAPLAASPFTGTSLTTLGAHRIQLTKWLWASVTTLTHFPSCARSQHRIVLSSLADSRYFPPGWKIRARIQLSCPVRVLMSVPRPSHILTVLSLEPVATNSAELLSGGGFLRPANEARFA